MLTLAGVVQNSCPPSITSGETQQDNDHGRKTKGSVDSGRNYRFERFKMMEGLKDMAFSKNVPGPGDRVPDFELQTLEGSTFSSQDLKETGPALMVFGSLTCPMTDSSAPGINELYQKYRDRVRFMLVAVREGHPGSSVPQPQTLAEKLSHAKMMRDFHGHSFEVAVDDVDGNFHKSLSPKPNSAYILDKDGTILFRAHWASDKNGLGKALASVVEGKPLRRTQSVGTMAAMMRMLRYLPAVLDRAGKGAWRDLWLGMPPIAMAGTAVKMLGMGRKKR